jgi:hypothetical protein
MKKFFSLLATLLVLALALWIGRTLWVHYMNTPVDPRRPGARGHHQRRRRRHRRSGRRAGA